MHRGRVGEKLAVLAKVLGLRLRYWCPKEHDTDGENLIAACSQSEVAPRSTNRMEERIGAETF